jgi:hypothetical protein
LKSRETQSDYFDFDRYGILLTKETVMKNHHINISDLPLITNRTDWARRLNLPVNKLLYEEQCGRLKGEKIGYSIFYSREDIVEWIKTHGRGYVTIRS